MINSVLKAIRVMRLFSASKPRLTLSEVSKMLDIPKSSAHNLLNTLASEGFIEKLDGNQYALGTAILPLTQAMRANVEIRDLAAPLLRELADTSNDSVYLTLRDGDYALYLYAVESPKRLISRTAVGDRVHMHCTAVGKAILAYMDRNERAGVFQRAGLPTFTDATYDDPDELNAHLDEVRRRGYSEDRAEHEDGVYCIGAPIFDHNGTVLGACSISGIDPSILTGQHEELVKMVTDTALQISRHMGFVPQRRIVVGEYAHT